MVREEILPVWVGSTLRVRSHRPGTRRTHRTTRD